MVGTFLERCDICESVLIEKNWKIDFFIDGKFISILNYPLMLCPTCASMKFTENINAKVLEKLLTKTHSRNNHPSAIKFEEHF